MLIGSTLRGWQIGVESVQGTIVAANRLLKNGNFKNTRKNNVRTSVPEGHRSSVGQARGKRSSEWSVSGDLGYNSMAYWGAGIYDAAGATPTNPATGAYVYTYGDVSTGLPTLHIPQTYSFEYGNSGGSNSKFAFGITTDMSIKISEDALTYDVAGVGAYPTKNITMTASPTIIPAVLVSFLDCRVSYSTTFAGLSAGKLTTTRSLELHVKSKYAAEFFIDDATTSIGGILEKKADMSGTIIVAEGTESDLFLGDLEASTQFYLQLRCTGSLLIAGSPSYFNSILYTWSCFVDTETEQNDKELFAGQYTLYSGEDLTNNDTNLVITNGLATL